MESHRAGAAARIDPDEEHVQARRDDVRNALAAGRLEVSPSGARSRPGRCGFADGRSHETRSIGSAWVSAANGALLLGLLNGSVFWLAVWSSGLRPLLT